MANSAREELQGILETLLGLDNVYFQPPPSIQMHYPCIVYQLYNMDTKFADNNPYSLKTQYAVTVIDKNPDSVIPGKIALLPTCRFDRFFAVDNLNHSVFNLFY